MECISDAFTQTESSPPEQDNLSVQDRARERAYLDRHDYYDEREMQLTAAETARWERWLRVSAEVDTESDTNSDVPARETDNISIEDDSDEFTLDDEGWMVQMRAHLTTKGRWT
jgi:hypothetical protein